VREKIIYYSNYLILLYAFLLPLNKNLVSVIGKILIILLFFKRDLKETIKNLWQIKLFRIFLVLVLYSVFISFYSSSVSYGIHYTYKKYLPYFEIFAIAVLLDKKYIKQAISLFLLGVFTSEIVSYGIMFGLWETHYNSAHFGMNDPTPFMHHTLYSLFLSIGILIILITILDEKLKSKKSYLLLFFLVTMSINLFVTGGRGGQVAFFITLFLLAFLYKNKKFLILIPVGFLFFILAYNLSELFHHRINLAVHDIKILINNFNFCSSWGIRASAWILTFEMLQGHWLFGLGYDNYTELMRYLIDTKFPYFDCSFVHLAKHLHNQYLTMLVDGGLIYLAIFIYALYNFYKVPVKDGYIRKIKFIVLSNFVILSFVEPVFFQSWSMYLFIFFAGIILACSRYEQLKE